jgi:hypothetical protein
MSIVDEGPNAAHRHKRPSCAICRDFRDFHGQFVSEEKTPFLRRRFAREERAKTARRGAFGPHIAPKRNIDADFRIGVRPILPAEFFITARLAQHRP